jgi:hypothetical protein
MLLSSFWSQAVLELNVMMAPDWDQAWVCRSTERSRRRSSKSSTRGGRVVPSRVKSREGPVDITEVTLGQAYHWTMWSRVVHLKYNLGIKDVIIG